MHSSGRAPAKRRTRPPPLSIRTDTDADSSSSSTGSLLMTRAIRNNCCSAPFRPLFEFEFCYSTASDKITDTPHPLFIALSCRVLCLPLGLMDDGGMWCICAHSPAAHRVESFHIRCTHRHIPRNSLESELFVQE